MKEHSAAVVPGGTVQADAAILKFQSDVTINSQIRLAASRVELKSVWMKQTGSSNQMSLSTLR